MDDAIRFVDKMSLTSGGIDTMDSTGLLLDREVTSIPPPRDISLTIPYHNQNTTAFVVEQRCDSPSDPIYPCGEDGICDPKLLAEVFFGSFTPSSSNTKSTTTDGIDNATESVEDTKLHKQDRTHSSPTYQKRGRFLVWPVNSRDDMGHHSNETFFFTPSAGVVNTSL